MTRPAVTAALLPYAEGVIAPRHSVRCSMLTTSREVLHQTLDGIMVFANSIVIKRNHL
jgi:hypothetical protein